MLDQSIYADYCVILVIAKPYIARQAYVHIIIKCTRVVYLTIETMITSIKLIGINHYRQLDM